MEITLLLLLAELIYISDLFDAKKKTVFCLLAVFVKNLNAFLLSLLSGKILNSNEIRNTVAFDSNCDLLKYEAVCRIPRAICNFFQVSINVWQDETKPLLIPAKETPNISSKSSKRSL